ncbi:hypothetical protein IE53DRAFT_274455 [Violaceomyces palustris]|uniref:Uncharacterized protein n=1 Tax=Violaceomyces palustris TaxID=1673888 RepID=A0ACD0P3A2_9BASI|nr:hypothetical protein IE53DRAFT_274455 [Violaceomyces palustris]
MKRKQPSNLGDRAEAETAQVCTIQRRIEEEGPTGKEKKRAGLKEDKAEMESSTSNGSATKAPAKRSALACLPCRAAKNKCDGVPPPLALEISSSQALKANPSDDIPSDQPCTRCARLEAACMWQPSHRTGRPKKKRRGSSSPDENESNTLFQHQSSGQSWKEAAQPIQSQGQQPLSTATPQPVASTIDQTQVASFDLSDQDLIALLNSSPFDSGQVDGRQFLGEVYGSVASSSAQGMAQSAAASRPSPAGKNAGAQHQAYTPYDFSISSAPFCELESLALGAMPSRAELTPPLSRDRGSSARSPLSSSRAGDQLSMLRSRISSAFPSSKTEIADRGRTMGSAPSPGILARANEVSRNPEYEVG